MPIKKKPNATRSGADHLLRNLCTVPSFAKKVGQKRQSIYYHVHTSKLIQPVYIGIDKDLYIDYSKYKNFDFREYPRDK